MPELRWVSKKGLTVLKPNEIPGLVLKNEELGV